MCRYVPHFAYKVVDTNASTIIATWHNNSWQATPEEVNITTMPVCRTALVLTLRRVTAHGRANARDVSPLADKYPPLVLLTKFHHSAVLSGCAFNGGINAWETMVDIVTRDEAPKWIVVGALATNEIEMTTCLKEFAQIIDPPESDPMTKPSHVWQCDLISRRVKTTS